MNFGKDRDDLKHKPKSVDKQKYDVRHDDGKSNNSVKHKPTSVHKPSKDREDKKREAVRQDCGKPTSAHKVKDVKLADVKPNHTKQSGKAMILK